MTIAIYLTASILGALGYTAIAGRVYRWLKPSADDPGIMAVPFWPIAAIVIAFGAAFRAAFRLGAAPKKPKLARVEVVK